MFRLLLTLYSLVYTLSLALYLPRLLYRILFQGKHRVNWLQRLGRLPHREAGESLPALWIHAVSVGEVKLLAPLIEQLQQADCRLFISTTTETGQSLARQLYRDRATCFYLPLDWRWTCRRFLRHLKPAALLLAETELWPGLIGAAVEEKIPLLLINGRISDRSFGRYQKIRFLIAPLLSRFDHLCMQSHRDKERIIRLGAPEARVHMTGNLKYDYLLEPSAEKEAVVNQLKGMLLGSEDERLWICGSTGQGEEAQLLAVFTSLRASFPDLKLMLAPRHPHRAAEVSRLAREAGFAVVRRSECESPQRPAPLDILVLDTIGELPYLYALADIVFIGGSLIEAGGHNVIEAAHFGKPILFGPHMENFSEIAAAFVQGYAALQVESSRELETRVADLLKDQDARKWLGRNARKVIRTNQGTLERTLDVLAPYLENLNRQAGGVPSGGPARSSDRKEEERKVPLDR